MSLLENTDKIHTTQMGVGRIKRNLKLNTDDVVGYCISKIKDKNAKISRKGKNYYVEADGCNYEEDHYELGKTVGCKPAIKKVSHFVDKK